MKRTVFFISDGTGITATNFGHSLLSQFEGISFNEITFPYVNNISKAQQVVVEITNAFRHDGKKPLVFATLVNPQIRALIENSPAIVMDFFNNFIGPLEDELGTQSSHTVGRTHGLKDYQTYMIRINAVHYAMANDDGSNIGDYDQADLIILGVSRCGKTPTCLYLALQYGLFAANYPLTDDDLGELRIPKFIMPYRNKIIGLTITAERLRSIREERRPNSNYSSLKTCQREINEAELLFKENNVPILDVTHRSIEELAAEIVTLTHAKKSHF